MKRATFNVLFFVKRTKEQKDGSIPIYARLTVNGQRVEFAIKRSVLKKNWDHARGKVKGLSKEAKQINAYMKAVVLGLNEARLYLEENRKEVNALSVKNTYLGVDEENKTLLEVFREHNEKCKSLVGIDYSYGTYEKYKTCYNHIENFIKIKYRKKDLLINEVAPAFIRDFEIFLKTTEKCSHNTTTKYLKNFKKITRLAISNGWLKKDPFRDVKFHLQKVDIDFLTEKELQALMEKNFQVERLNRVKDVYLFSCFTGLAFIDVYSLTSDDIVIIGGQQWIKKKRQKTKNWFKVPLLPPALKILKKYKNDPECKVKGKLLPVLSNQKMNAYLKEIATIMNIRKNLTTHTARHTFATTVTLTNQVSIEVVSKMLGHSSINMTKRYARVVDDLISKNMSKLYVKYQNVSMQA